MSDKVSRRAENRRKERKQKEKEKEKQREGERERESKGPSLEIDLFPAEAMAFADRPVDSRFVTIKKPRLFVLLVTVKVKGITGPRLFGRY